MVSHYQFLNAIIARFFLKKLQKFKRESGVNVSYYDSLSDRTEGPSEKAVYLFSHLLRALRTYPHLWSRPSLVFYWRWVSYVFTQGTDVFASYAGETPSYPKLFATAGVLNFFCWHICMPTRIVFSCLFNFQYRVPNKFFTLLILFFSPVFLLLKWSA